jgi:hypothetical protein
VVGIALDQIFGDAVNALSGDLRPAGVIEENGGAATREIADECASRFNDMSRSPQMKFK